MNNRLHDILLGAFLGHCIAIILPDVHLFGLIIPTEIALYIFFLLIHIVCIYIIKKYRKLVKKFADDVKMEINNQLNN